jgi:tRNA 2-thiocytidine biosynthesis protein TtcA
MTALIGELEKTNPHVRSIMANALRNVRPTHLLDRDVQRAWAERSPEIRPAAPVKEPRKQHAVAAPVFSGGKLRVVD